jgi:uncharacterized protein
MKRLLSTLSHYFETVPDRMRRRKWLVWLLFMGVTVFAAFGIQRTEFDMSLEGWFSEDDPIKLSLDDFHAEFGSDDGVFLVYRPKDGNVFSAKSLRAIKGIREDLLSFRLRLKEGETSALDHIVRINSLINAPVLKTEGDSLISKQLVGSHIPTSQEELIAIRKTAESQKNFPLLYFSKDLKYGGLFIETDFGTIPVGSEKSPASDIEEDLALDEELEMDEDTMTVSDDVMNERIKFQTTDMDTYLELMKEINAILEKPEYADHMDFYAVGNAPMMDYSMEIIEEIGPMYVVMILIIVVMLWALFRSLSAVVWPISIVILSTVWTVGLTGWMGITITTMLMLTIMLILAVGTADAIHILSGYLFFRNQSHDHQAAMRLAFQKSALACLLTTVTTMLGMLALTVTPIAHMQTFGYMSAAGVGLALIFTIYLLPFMMDLWSPVKAEKQDGTLEDISSAGLFSKIFHLLKRIGGILTIVSSAIGRYFPNISILLQKMLDRVLPLVLKSPYGFAMLFLSVFGLCLYGATLVKVDSNLIEQFKEGTEIRAVYEIVDREMMGSQNLEVYLNLESENAFKDPFVLNIMDELQQQIADKYSKLVVKTSSLVDIVKDSYQTLNGGRPEMYVIPERKDMLSQTLFLFNNANPEDRRKLVSDNYSRSHISVQLYNAGSYEYTNVFDAMRLDIDKAVRKIRERYPEATVTITGGLALMMELSDYITWSQLKSLGLVIGVISIILIFIFGSFRAGFISIIPNLIPATLTFGLLGLLGMPLDADTMMIAPVIIGIAVDDTIHFITHYRAEVLIDSDIVRALRDTIKEVGQAITFTTLILGFGFSIMAFSSHVGMSNMGRFGTLAIFVALLCDLFLLPSLILIFKPRFLDKREIELSITG